MIEFRVEGLSFRDGEVQFRVEQRYLSSTPCLGSAKAEGSLVSCAKQVRVPPPRAIQASGFLRIKATNQDPPSALNWGDAALVIGKGVMEGRRRIWEHRVMEDDEGIVGGDLGSSNMQGPESVKADCWESPKIRGPSLAVPIKRTRVFWGLHWE